MSRKGDEVASEKSTIPITNARRSWSMDILHERRVGVKRRSDVSGGGPDRTQVAID